MAQYRHRQSTSLLVDATQYQGDVINGVCSCEEISAILRDREQDIEDDLAAREEREPVPVDPGPRHHFHRPDGTVPAVLRLNQGDWIVINSFGQVNYCSAESFPSTYEAV